VIYYERDALPEDHWRHPDIAAFYAEHAERYEVIREREWQREYEAAPRSQRRAWN